MVIDTALLRLAFPLLAFDLAIRLDERQIGLLHDLPAMPAIVLDVWGANSNFEGIRAMNCQTNGTY